MTRPPPPTIITAVVVTGTWCMLMTSVTCPRGSYCCTQLGMVLSEECVWKLIIHSRIYLFLQWARTRASKKKKKEKNIHPMRRASQWKSVVNKLQARKIINRFFFFFAFLPNNCFHFQNNKNVVICRARSQVIEYGSENLPTDSFFFYLLFWWTLAPVIIGRVKFNSILLAS